MWSNEVDVANEAHLNAELDLEGSQLWQAWPGNNRPIFKGRFLCGPDHGVIGFNIFLIASLSVIFQVWVAPRLHWIVNVVEVVLVLVTLFSLAQATWTEAGILPRQSFQRLQHDYTRLPTVPPMVKVVSQDGSQLLSIPNGMTEVDSTPIQVDPVTGERTALKFCSTCKIFRPTRAKHCRDCDNCVEDFDHHCPWTNSCIGARNYKFFVRFVISVTITTSFVAICSVALLAIETSNHGFSEAISSQPVAACIALLTFMLSWCLCSLSGYHIWLLGQGLTTNEHIQLQRLQHGGGGGRPRGNRDLQALPLGNQPDGIVDDGGEELSYASAAARDGGCGRRFWRFLCTNEVEASHFDLRAPLGRSIFARTIGATESNARDEERRAVGLMPVAMPVHQHLSPAPYHSGGSGVSGGVGGGGASAVAAAAVTVYASAEAQPLSSPVLHEDDDTCDADDDDAGSRSYSPSASSSNAFASRNTLDGPSQVHRAAYQQHDDHRDHEEPFDFVIERRTPRTDEDDEDEDDERQHEIDAAELA